MKKTVRYTAIHHYFALIRRNALRCALSMLALYLVCDYLAQIRPMTTDNLLQTCLRDMNALLTRLPYVEPTGSPGLLPRPGANSPAVSPGREKRPPSLGNITRSTPDGETRKFLNEHYGIPVESR